MQSQCDNADDLYLWTDHGFGKNGRGLWVVPIGFAAILYQMVFLVRGFLQSSSSVEAVFFYVGVIFVLVMFLLLFALIFIQGLSTARKVAMDKRKYFKVDCFFIRTFRFYADQVAKVDCIERKFFRDFVIPQGRGGRNYRVRLTDGRTFYLNNAISDVRSLVNRLESM